MKVFVLRDDRLKEELSRIGKVITVKKGNVAEDGVIFSGKKVAISAEMSFKDALEILADLGYDFVALEGFDDEDLPVVSSVEDVLSLPDFETLKSLIIKVKSLEDSVRCGAIGIFIGFVRKISGKKEVLKLEYEKYDDLFEKKLKEIEERLKDYPGVVDVRIYHKIGSLHPGEDIIYVVVMGEHRKDIWRPLEEGMELVKEELPVWKKEVYIDGEVWVHDKE
jgi:molybdopterin synthase catalytic subunit